MDLETAFPFLWLLAILVMSVLAIGLGIRSRRRLSARRRDTRPKVRSAPTGQLVDIPVIAIRRYRRFPQFNPRGAFSPRGYFQIRPDGIEYRISWRRVAVPFPEIELVDGPPPELGVTPRGWRDRLRQDLRQAGRPVTRPGRRTFTLQLRGRSKRVAVLATSDEALRYALSVLAHRCPLTDQARTHLGAGAGH